MKKYIFFAISFILLFSLFQVMVGIFLTYTYTYTPDITKAWNMGTNQSQALVIGHSPFLLTLLIAILSAAIAYFVSKRISINKSVN